MGIREFQYDEGMECDGCGKSGAFDFYGDFLCDDCIEEPKRKRSVDRIMEQGRRYWGDED